MSNQPEVISFGCRLNAYEAEVIKRHAEEAGWTDTVIVNSCAVTSEAERQTRQTIRKLRRENPNVRIVVTGCAAQINPEKFGSMKEVDQIIGNDEKMRASTYHNPSQDRILVGDIMRLQETASHLISGFEGKARAFIEIQQGCDHRCSFCIVPFGRGSNRSIPQKTIISQIRQLVDAGFGEVVLTGVDIASYGRDLTEKKTLGNMIMAVLAEIPDLSRLRLSSIDPIAIDEDFQRAIAEEPRLMPHFHLSIQSGNDLILKRMKRRHLREDIILLARKLRSLRPDLALGADFIAGFPTESDAMHEDSLSLIDLAGLTHLHVFPYSSRPGTAAAKMPGLTASVVHARAAELRLKGHASMKTFLASRLGRQVQVLVEKDDQGYCEHFIPVQLDHPIEAGKIVSVKITGAGDKFLNGTAIDV